MECGVIIPQRAYIMYLTVIGSHFNVYIGNAYGFRCGRLLF